VAPVEAMAAPRCQGHKTNGEPCLNPAIRGATVCRKHGGSAPQVRRAAALRMAMAADVFARGLVEMATDKRHLAQRLQAIKEGLERNQLYAEGVTSPSQQRGGRLTVNTQFNTKVSAMTDLADTLVLTGVFHSPPNQ
jgi:hypothetical protein